jgi:pilus assembly protein Flp/PilA
VTEPPSVAASLFDASKAFSSLFGASSLRPLKSARIRINSTGFGSFRLTDWRYRFAATDLEPTWSCHMSRLLTFLKDEKGATAIEYGLIAAGISIVIITSVNAIGSSLNGTFTTISTKLSP